MVSPELKTHLLSTYYNACKKKFIKRSVEYDNWKKHSQWPPADYFEEVQISIDAQAYFQKEFGDEEVKNANAPPEGDEDR